MMQLNTQIDGDGQTLVLFHGWGFDSTVWELIVNVLNVFFRVVRIDLPGHGLSPWQPWDGFKKTLLNQLPEKFALVGWSLGGLYALRLAAEEPSRITHLMNVASSPYFIRESNWPGVNKRLFQSFRNQMDGDLDKTISQFIDMNCPCVKSAPGLQSQVYDSKGLYEGMHALETWDYRSELGDMNMPVCFLFGFDDAIVPVKTMSAMQDRYPLLKTLLFKKAGHDLFLSEPGLFLSTLIHFIHR